MHQNPYTLEHIRFLATDSIQLAGLLHTPHTRTTTVALFLHGNGSASIFESVEKTKAYAKALTSRHIAFFSFNNRGSGYIRKLKREINGKVEELKGGTSHELIKDCIHDIDGAVELLQKKGFTRFFLIGESTGANKIVVYNLYKKDHAFSACALVGGGDDTGIYYQFMGEKRFFRTLERCKMEIEQGNGTELASKSVISSLMSYGSLYDTMNPDGDYNIFPFYEYIHNLSLSTKPLFRQLQHLQIASLILYGEHDEFCYGKVPEVITILKTMMKGHSNNAYVVIPGGDHGLSQHLDISTSVIAEWLEKNL